VTIHILSVGKLKDKAHLALVAEYEKRLRWKCTTRELKPSRKDSAEQRKADEAAALLAHVPDSALVIALDERGQAVTSPAFSALLVAANEAAQDVCLIIGGADGLDSLVRTRANHIISFGALTWPHQLVRVMLAEQLYRAYTLATGHPYHRE
jgi:23S rRNA (pseudouridine1915-N3)-methyltransferase